MLKEIKDLRNSLLKWEEDLSKLTIDDLLLATRKWFDHYQKDQDPEAMVELYSKLIDEEREETINAWRNWDIIEVLDWIIDYAWVMTWFMHFGEKLARSKWEETASEEEVNRRIWQTVIMMLWWTMCDWELIKLAWLEVAYSNWTKSLELRDESDEEWKVWKVIKGKWYKKPNLKKVFKSLKSVEK